MVDDLLARVRAAAALDQVQRVADLVGAVDAQLDLPGAGVVEQRNPDLARELAAGPAGRHGDELAAAAHQVAHRLDEPAGGRARAEPQYAALWQEVERGMRRLPLQVVLAHGLPLLVRRQGGVANLQRLPLGCEAAARQPAGNVGGATTFS